MSQHSNSPQELTETNQSIYGEESFRMKDFTVGAIVGAVIGAAAALLYAPRAGADLRQNVASQVVTLKEKGIDLSSVAKDKSVQFSSQIKEQSTQLVEKVKAKAFKETSNVTDEDFEQASILDDIAEAIEGTVEGKTTPLSQKADATIEEILEETKS